MKNVFYTFIIILFLVSCDDPVTITTTQQVAIEGYIHANDTAQNIRLTTVLTTEDSLIRPIDDALIEIRVDGQTYGLTNVGEGYYENKNLVFESTKSYELYFEYFDTPITAQTIVPTKPDSLEISETEVAITQITSQGGFGGGGGTFPDPIAVTWDNSDGSYYFVVVDNMETNLQYVNTLRVPEEPTAFHFISQPQITDVFSLDARRNLPQYGTYRIVVYKINPEYAALYETLDNSSLNLSEPATNVVNGVGIFTGVNSDTLWLEVRKG